MHSGRAQSTNVALLLSDASLSSAVVLKPNKLHTLQRLQVAVLASLPSIARPAATTIDWLAEINVSVMFGCDNKNTRK